MKKLLICLVAMAVMLNSCQQKQQAEPANPNNLFSSLLGKSRGFDPASEDDMDDNGMSRYMENNDEEGWD